MIAWLIAATLLPTAIAAEPSELDRAWYLAETSRPEAAMASVSQLLHEDPSDTAAHRLHAWLWIKALREAEATEQLYRGWLEQEPETDAARIALANILRWRNRYPGDWCAEAEGLLVQPPASLEDSYWAQRVLFEIRKVCPGDQEAPRLAIMKLGEQLPEARAYGLRLQLDEQPVDAVLAEQLEALFAAQPWRLTYAGNPWMMRGDELERVRASALEAAASAAASDDPLLVESARRLYRYAGEQEQLLDAEDRLAALDPGYAPNRFERAEGVQWVARPEQADDEIMGLVRAASRGAKPRRAIAEAKVFEAQLPDSGPTRAAYHAHMMGLHDDANQPIKALEAARAAWQADPGNPDLANEFAWRAAVSGVHVEQALEAIEGAVQRLPAYDARGDHLAWNYDDWQAWRAQQAASIADTHGWVLYRLERYEDAAAVLREALLLASRPHAVHHLHLGLCYDALGNEQEALRQLGRGMALAGGEDEDLERQAYARLVELFHEHRWAPGGLEDWIAMQLPSVEDADGGGPELHQDRSALRHGHPLADISFTVGGAERSLSEFEGVKVVDLWATWCGPCIEAMPSMDKLAKRYADRGVTFVAISVDADPELVEAHFEGDYPEHLIVGWAGRKALREARVTGIPSMFVIDDNGIIRHHHSGWDLSPGGDKRSREKIAEAIDEVLEGYAKE